MSEVSHKEIYDRLLAVETKVDKLQEDTSNIVVAFSAAQGAFTVLEWLAKVVKPILIVGGFLTALIAVWTNHKV